MKKFSKLETEMIHPKTTNIDSLSTYEILKVINNEDKKIASVVEKTIDKIAIVVEACVNAIKNGGRVIYAGAGTSGRVGFLDATEVVPTFGVKEGLFVALIAGGDEALKRSVEAVEDDEELGKMNAKEVNIDSKDFVIGITASGRTPYVKGVLSFAKAQGCSTALVCNVSNPELSDLSDVVISILTGPEVIAGSTRMKAGTSQKMVLNMISTVTMIKLGKVYKNYMVDVLVLNEKLKERAKRIIMESTGVNYEVATDYLEKSNNKPKVAILMILTGKDADICEKLLQRYWSVNEALKHADKM